MRHSRMTALQRTSVGRRVSGRRALKTIAAIGTVAIALTISGCMPYSSALSNAGAALPFGESVVRPDSRSAPDRISIPVIGVNASLMRLGLRSDRSLQVPPNAYTAGWYTGAPQPGQIGPAVIAAHVRWNGTAGAFAKLSKLQPGHRIIVYRKNGTSAVFSVERVKSFKKDRFPTNLVYGNLNYAGLRLITCDGLNASNKNYLANLVVFARLVDKA
ncbi:MAG: class F sortase [Actinomycetota bacterium]|nr:class F sortase [Actinomycetota bacterium]